MAPGNINMPSPSLSVLKNFLSKNGFNVEVLYWNLKFHELQSDFIWNDKVHIGDSDNLKSLYLYYNYLAIKSNDKIAYEFVKVALKEIKPQYMCAGKDFFDEHMRVYAKKLDDALDIAIREIDFSKILYWGLSVNLYQWISSHIVAEKIKSYSPNTKIVIGGIGTPQSAQSFLKNFSQFDIAFWGESEYSLLEYSKQLVKGDINLHDIKNIIYRNDGGIVKSKGGKKQYVDLSSADAKLVFNEYFDSISKYGISTDVFLSIEGSRSCHWKKCRFCYLNHGYKYRKKNVDVLINEIDYLITKYGEFKFQFLDNDVIGDDITHFENLLDELCKLKEKHVDFQIILAEIISKDLNRDVIRKMSIAGFRHIQIGYESPSDNLLKKIDKKNTFASNFLFLKFANEYNISVTGANVLRNLLEETDEDIQEAIDNLYLMRFILVPGWFQHNMSTLGVNSSSKYYESIKNDKELWKGGLTSSLLPSNLIDKDSVSDILEVFKNTYNGLWNQFERVESYFLKSKFSYKVLLKRDSFIYREYCNHDLINELEVEFNSPEYYVLSKANDQVSSLDSIVSSLTNNSFSKNIILESIDELRSEGLLFHSKDYSEIISVIDISKLS